MHRPSEAKLWQMPPLTVLPSFPLTPAFYEMTLKRKIMNDEESWDMLDIIFGTQVYNVFYQYQIGGIYGMMFDLHNQLGRDVASRFMAIADKAQADLETFIENYK